MKLIQYDEEYIIYLNNLYIKEISLDNSEEISEYIKKLLLKLKDYYNIELSGFYRIYVYTNKLYGIIMEIIKVEDYDDFGIDNIDLKIILKKNSELLLKTENYDLVKDIDCFFVKDGFYYINIENIDKDYIHYVEFFDIIYKDVDKIIKDAQLIRR
ncbi:MAG: hypothetical protein ACI4OT_05995 [Bacilli bacterium]